MRTSLPGLLLLVVTACGPMEELAPPGLPPASFEAGLGAETEALRERVWDDGAAEVALYTTRERRYGTLREGEGVLIVVKEDLDAQSLVKADGPAHTDTMESIKLNTIVTTPAGVYTYRQMASTWLTRDGHPIRLATSSQDWCGITNKVLTLSGDRALLRTSSYFGAEAERSFGVDLDGRTLLGDSLPLFVRTMNLRNPGIRNLRVLDEQLSNHAPAPRFADAIVEVGLPQVVDVPAGRYGAVPVSVTRDDRREVLWLDAEAPHVLLKWERADGGEWALTTVRRLPYWRLHDPEHVGALERPPPVPDLPEVPDLSAEPPPGAPALPAVPDLAADPPPADQGR